MLKVVNSYNLLLIITEAVDGTVLDLLSAQGAAGRAGADCGFAKPNHYGII